MGRKKKEDLNKPVGKDEFEIKVNEFGAVITSFSIDKLNNLLNRKTKEEAEKNKKTPSDPEAERSDKEDKSA